LAVSAQNIAEAIEACSNTLSKLPQNRVKFDSRRTINQNITEWFCSDKFLQDLRDQSVNLDVTVPIKGVPVPFKLAQTIRHR
jgi:hypothetical protein